MRVTNTSTAPRARRAAFDPVAVGRAECAAWAAYYRHEWGTVLRATLTMVGAGFGTGPLATVRGAYHVLQANRAWAPPEDNDPDRARAEMKRLYRIVRASGWGEFDPVRAAALEVEWWRVHRSHQRGEVGVEPLVDALDALYAHVYAVPPGTAREAGRLRAEAMDVSDAWVAAGCDPGDPRLDAERRALVASYTALREAVERHELRAGISGPGAAR